MFKKTDPPLLVVVNDMGWWAYGPDTVRNRWLTAVITNEGGVNESVPPGNYHFNIVRKGFKLISTFEPAEQ